MSYLLNHRSTGGGAKLPHRILPLRSTGLSAQRPLHMGRGQLQIQRLAAPQQQQSQHQSTQGVISMEEGKIYQR